MRQIVRDCKADSVLALKDNQKTLYDEMLLLFEKELTASPQLFAKYEAPEEKNSGRIEKRTCWQTDYVEWFESIDEWYGLRSVIIHAMCKCASLQADSRQRSAPAPMFRSIGAGAGKWCWGLAHLHICTFARKRSDYCRARTKHAAANRASVRRMALSLTLPWATRNKCGIRGAMMSACFSEKARLEMLTA